MKNSSVITLIMSDFLLSALQSHGREAVPVHRMRPGLRPEVQREEAHADAQGVAGWSAQHRVQAPRHSETSSREHSSTF